MKNAIPLVAAVVAISVAMTSPLSASTLSKLGNAGTYPAKKVVKNTGHNAKQPVKSVTGPVNQAGQTTTRTFHKVVK